MRRSVGIAVVAVALAGGCTRPPAAAEPTGSTSTASSTPSAAPSDDTAAQPSEADPGLGPTSDVPASGPTSTAAPITTPITITTTSPITTTTASTTATTATTTTTTPPWPRTITMAFSGDILPHSPLWRQAARNAEGGSRTHDFGPMLANLRHVHAAVDLAVCHLETPIAPEGEEFTTNPFYGVPAEIADAIAIAGFDRCSTASNHTADRGSAGIDRTVNVLESRGIAQSGMARTPDEIEPAVFEVDGVGVSHLSYTWSYNGLSLAQGEEWRSALIDPDRIIADALTARALGAAVVVVSLHWGAEGVHQPTRFQREVAETLTASGAVDLIVGHHAHVVQPIERINDRWVVFGLGNILSNLPTSSHWPAASQDAMVVTVALTVDAAGAVTVERPEAHPTWVDKDAGWVVRLVADELAGDELPAGQRGRLERSLDRTRSVVGDHVTEPPSSTTSAPPSTAPTP